MYFSKVVGELKIFLNEKPGGAFFQKSSGFINSREGFN